MTARICTYADDGRIMSIVELPENQIQFQEQNWLEAVDGVTDASHYVDVVNKVYVPMPEQPSKYHYFSYAMKSWLDMRPFSVIQDMKWADIKAKRTAIEFGPFEYNGMVFDGDEDAQRRLSIYISISKSQVSMGKDFEAKFILANNAVVTLDAQDFIAIEIAKATQVADAFAKAADLRAAIYATTNEQDLANINWS